MTKPAKRTKKINIEELVDGIIAIIRLSPSTEHRVRLEVYLKARLK